MIGHAVFCDSVWFLFLWEVFLVQSLVQSSFLFLVQQTRSWNEQVEQKKQSVVLSLPRLDAQLLA